MDWKSATIELHWGLHQRSPGFDPEVYRWSPGWEEGVVEAITRLDRERMMREIGEYEGVGAAGREKMRRDRAYEWYFSALEALRRALGREDAKAFYDAVFRVPLGERPAHVIRAGLERYPSGPERESWSDMALRADWILRLPRRPERSRVVGSGGAEDLEEGRRMLDELEARMRDPDPRERLVSRVLSARAPAGIDAARHAVREWLREHPEDEHYLARHFEQIVIIGWGLEDPD